MKRHRGLFVLTCTCGAAFAVALIIWLNGRSDSTLTRWSAIATVVAAVATVLTLVLMVLQSSGGAAASDFADEQHGLEGGRVIQQGAVVNSGTINQQGRGVQVNNSLPPKEP